MTVARRARADQLPLETEAQFQRRVLQLARVLRWIPYHTLYSLGSNAGFPDLVLCRDRILYRELKREGGKLTDRQAEWQLILKAAGGDVSIWYPSDWERIVLELQ